MNDAMAEILRVKGYNLEYQKYAEGHSWGNWRGHLDEGFISVIHPQVYNIKKQEKFPPGRIISYQG